MNVTRVRRIEEEVADPGDLLTLSEVQREYGIEVWRLSMALDKGLLDAYLVPSSNPRKGARQVRRADIEQWIKPILIGVPEDESYRNMNKEELLAAAGVTNPTRDTYLYVDRAGRIQATEKNDRDAYPTDEATPIGYARKL
jgi:hypothetical protein